MQPRKHGTASPHRNTEHCKHRNTELDGNTEVLCLCKLAIKMHKTLGSGFVEKVYQRAYYLELKNSGLKFEREKKIIIKYNKAVVGYSKVDFDIEDKVLLEFKAVTEIQNMHKAQMISYLKAAGRKIGLIINFAKPIIEIKRIIN